MVLFCMFSKSTTEGTGVIVSHFVLVISRFPGFVRMGKAIIPMGSCCSRTAKSEWMCEADICAVRVIASKASSGAIACYSLESRVIVYSRSFASDNVTPIQ